MDIRTLTPTICRLMNVEPPQLSIPQVQESLIAALKRDGIEKIDKCLIYAPDAIGQTIHEKYPEYFSGIKQIIKYTQPLQSVYPPKTPICFGSMFSGVYADFHGMKMYERPVLEIDTIFDAMVRSRKRVAIIAVERSSIDRIFRERELDYYSETNDADVIEKALNVLDKYDFLVLYNQEYDDCLHRTQPYSAECLQALEHYNQAYLDLYKAINNTWKKDNWLLAYAPDHGAHLNAIENIGTHGKNIPEDMNLLHHYTYSAPLKR